MKYVIIVISALMLYACSTIAPLGSVAESSLTAMKYQIDRTEVFCGNPSVSNEIDVLKKIANRLNDDFVDTQFSKDTSVIAKNVGVMKTNGSVDYCKAKLQIIREEINVLIRTSKGTLRK